MNPNLYIWRTHSSFLWLQVGALFCWKDVPFFWVWFYFSAPLINYTPFQPYHLLKIPKLDDRQIMCDQESCLLSPQASNPYFRKWVSCIFFCNDVIIFGWPPNPRLWLDSGKVHGLIGCALNKGCIWQFCTHMDTRCPPIHLWKFLQVLLQCWKTTYPFLFASRGI